MESKRTYTSSRTRLPAKGVRSLVFVGDSLVDHVCGGDRYDLDGTTHTTHIGYAFPFDCAVRTGRFAVIYQRLGTKAAVIDVRTNRVIRELDRSYYHSGAYAYPIGVWTDAEGRELVAHCPESYDRIEIEVLETGERLTASTEREPKDYFHSRLTPSPDGRWLLSAGWVWHPWDFVGWFDLGEALYQPTLLDDPIIATAAAHMGCLEEAGACWLDAHHLLLASSDEGEDPDDFEEIGDTPRLHAPGLAIVDVRTRSVTHGIALPHPPGVMLPIGTDAVLTFFEHPRLYRLADGVLLEQWPDLPTGRHVSSIIHHLDPMPPIALDPEGRRFAVATENHIEVVTLR